MTRNVIGTTKDGRKRRSDEVTTACLEIMRCMRKDNRERTASDIALKAKISEGLAVAATKRLAHQGYLISEKVVDIPVYRCAELTQIEAAELDRAK